VRVNAGGDPDRDDFGLPPIDIEIPDDARELDRDVQAYQRELRAQKRRRRASRLYGPLTRDGMALPLLAGCLMLALLTSTLLIMFAADQTGVPQLPPRATATAKQNLPKRTPTAAEPAAGKLGGPLPTTAVVIGGKNIQLRDVTAAMASVLTLVPANCNCAATLRQLSGQAAQERVMVYLVGTPGSIKQVTSLAAQAGQAESHVANDTGDVLGSTYGQKGVTAILVRADGTVASVITRLPQQQMTTALQQIAPAKPAGH
jgi:hypothetical protein